MLTAPQAAAHWAARYVGTPWVPGESDCWSLARRVWAERFGWDVPAVPVDPCDARGARRALAAPAPALWRPADRLPLAEGDALLMAQGVQPCHVGVIVLPGDGPAVLHATRAAGAAVTPLARLDLLGYRPAGRWRWRDA